MRCDLPEGYRALSLVALTGGVLVILGFSHIPLDESDRREWLLIELGSALVFLVTLLFLCRADALRRVDEIERIVRERTGELQRTVATLEHTAAELATERERLEADLDAAGAIQRSLLPSPKLDLPGLRVAWRFLPCETVGGDLLNVLSLNDRYTAFYCLDVSGHGIQAALTSVALARLLSAWGAESSLMVTASGRIRWPREVVGLLNERFFADVEERQFFTIVYGLINHPTRTVSYVRAGHPLPYLVNSRGDAEFVTGGDVPVGFASSIPYREIERSVDHGTRLFLYSDGITEALSGDGRDRFGTERLAAALGTTPEPLDDSLERLLAEVIRFQGSPKPKDDISVLALEIA